jgi:Ca2+-binding RTX toxin-like protein
MDIRKLEIFGEDVDVRYADGTREEVEGGWYERKDSSGDTVEKRPASDADISRLTALAATYEASIVPLDDVVVAVQIAGGEIDVIYDSGIKEEIEDGVYEINNANGRTIFERPATAEDFARLTGLEPGETGSGGTGTSEPNPIDGTGGDDNLEGTSGGDVIVASGGSDEVRGRGGDDALHGGDGNDEVRGDRGNDTVTGGAGNDLVRGDDGDDTASGGDGDDRVKGGDGNDLVSGDAGNDRVEGGTGNDTVSGGDGDDLVKGNDGDDVLNGDGGRDAYDGGLGADTFVFGVDGSFDKIKDFQDGIDRIDLSAFGFAGVDDFTMTQSGSGDVYLDLGGGDIIKVDDVSLAQLTDADFLF